MNADRVSAEAKPNPSAAPSWRRRAARILTALIALGFALVFAEVALRAWGSHLSRSDRLEPGMIRRDGSLGWRLSPGWTGRHTHHDFAVSYSIDSDGFRRDPQTPEPGTNDWVAVVGDSFTFGLGVQDEETFCSQLNRLAGRRFINFGVPGYSTDQELLLIEREILPRKPKEIWLVVYLGNDLLDNLRNVPVQVSAPKPRFALQSTGLHLISPTGTTGDSSVVGPGSSHSDLLPSESAGARWQAWVGRSRVFGLLEGWIPGPEVREDLRLNAQASLELFGALLDRLLKATRPSQTRVTLVLLGSGSLVHRPRSLSGQYQEFLRDEIQHMAESKGLPVMDLAGDMVREAKVGPSSGSKGWYHPNEGHLTPAGHLHSARVLNAALSGRAP